MLAAVLQIWLTQTSDLRPEAPALDPEVIPDVSMDRPPAIGLIKRVRPLAVPYEHYQVPITQDLIKGNPVKCEHTTSVFELARQSLVTSRTTG
jgi:hypothetical protein